MNRLITYFLLFLLIIFGCSTGTFFYLLEKDWVDFSALECTTYAKPSIILDEEGREIARFELDRRDPITYDKIPDILIKAFIAAEDHRFFEHSGISVKGILRSVLVNIVHGKVVQGASTITQQLAKLMFLSYERTFTRKIQEVFLAFQLERQLSKEQILELYLNHIYFGRGIYGVEAACRRFWNKPLIQLTIPEAATLAAVAKSARFYSPLNAPASARKRRDLVLTSMYNLGFVNHKDFAKSQQTPLEILDYTPGNPIRLYIQEFVRTWAEAQWGRDALYHNGLKIKTTINIDTQEAAEASFTPIIHQLQTQTGASLNGGLTSIEPWTGKIRAVIGGLDFRKSQFNRAFYAHRQMGSSVKPLIYAYALHAGLEMDTIMVDEPLEVVMPQGQQSWTPKNWNDQFEGPMTLIRALTFSNNIITVKLFLQLCSPDLVEWIKRFGIKNEIALLPSSALGTTEVTVEENCAAFNVFANNGIYTKPYLIESVIDNTGALLWETTQEKYRVLDSKRTGQMVNALSWRMKLNQRLSEGWFDSESIGKTGSTNGAASMWFVGATPDLTTAIYVGRDDNKPMGTHAFASRTAFPIWLNFNRAIPHYKKHFYIDPDLREVTIDWVTGQPSYEQPLGDYELRVVKILKPK